MLAQEHFSNANTSGNKPKKEKSSLEILHFPKHLTAINFNPLFNILQWWNKTRRNLHSSFISLEIQISTPKRQDPKNERDADVVERFFVDSL